MTEPADTPQPTNGDQSRRFLFEEADIRGESVHLDSAYREILAIHEYACGVGRLLGEFLSAAVLLSTNLKFEGKLVLQVRSEGQIPLLMVECDHALQVRGIANLWVADASVFPALPVGNTNATAIMVGDKGADHVLKTLR